MNKLIALYFTLFLLTATWIAPAFAQAQTKEILPPSARKVERYLQNLTTAHARFLQTGPDGSQLTGTFYLSRPGKLRFEYDDPIDDFIVADGFFIYFYDSELGEQSNAPIGQTLADFILRRDLSLSGDLQVADIRHTGQLMLITLTQSDDPAAGSITLGFDPDPLELKKWRITDGAGFMTEIELSQFEKDVTFDRRDLFAYRDPNTGGAPSYND
jgi:outer membrane lipoprotein-sorting protein